MANVDWKSLEGQYFRLDVGSTMEEALSATDNSVLHICTDGAIVMNGEVVAVNPDGYVVNIHNASMMCDNIYFYKSDTTSGNRRGITFLIDDINEFKKQNDAAMTFDSLAYELNYYKDSLDLSYVSKEVWMNVDDADNPSKIYSINDRSRNEISKLRIGYASKEEIGGSCNLWIISPEDENTAVCSNRLFSSQGLVAPSISFCSKLPDGSKFDFATSSIAGFALGCGYLASGFTGKVDNRDDIVEKYIISAYSMGVYEIAGNKIALKTSKANDDSVISLEGKCSFTDTAKFTGSNNGIYTSVDSNGLHFLNTSLGGYELRKYPESNIIALRVIDKNENALTYNAFQSCFALSSDGKSVDTSSASTYFGILNNALKVYGSGNVNIKGNLTVGGSVTQATTSDIRAKENINYEFDAIAKLAGLGDVCEYDYKDGGKHSYGLIAQTLEKNDEFKDMVGVKTSVDDQGNEVEDADGMRYVNYLDARLVPLLIKSVQQLSDKVNALEKEIEELKK